MILAYILPLFDHIHATAMRDMYTNSKWLVTGFPNTIWYILLIMPFKILREIFC